MGGFNAASREKLTAILDEPGNGIILCSVLRQMYSRRHGKSPCSKKALRNAIANNWPGVTLGYGGRYNGPSDEYAVRINSIVCLLNGHESGSFTIDEVRMFYQRKYHVPIPIRDDSLMAILRSVNISITPTPRDLKPLSDTSILRDKYVPQYLKDLNRHPTALQWNVNKQRNMDQVITLLAKDFIPSVPCTCAPGINVHEMYTPNAISPITPNLRFALQTSILDISPSKVVDLDETDIVKEYTNSFRHTVKLEYEERMRLYEHYSLYAHQIKAMTNKTAKILIPGIMDARPSLSIADIVLLRPLQPIMVPQYDYHRNLRITPNTLEIQSRIVDMVRGRRDEPDSIVISWELDIGQKELLKDDHFMRQYNIRFVPEESFPQICNTALGWLDKLSDIEQKNIKNLLFPVVAPMVKPLDYEQMAVDMSCLAGDFRNSDVLKPLNEQQASFLRMIRARTLDPAFQSIRPACILTGPAGTGKTKTLIAAIAEVLGLLKKDKTNKNRVLLCAPSHAAADVLTERLTAILRRDEIFRMYNSSRPSVTVPGKILPFTVQMPGSDIFTLPSPEGWTKFRVVVCTCMDAHILYRAQLTNYAIRTKRYCFVSYLRGNNPIGLDFGGGKVRYGKEPFFSHLFVDEAGQATEPEVLCPMSVVLDPVPGEQKVEIALIGDPRQLSPRIYSEKAALHGLGRSFMERILKRPVECIGRGESHILGPDTLKSLDGSVSSILDLERYYMNIDGQEQLTIFLTENYRGHPSFLMMPSVLFYYDRLKSAKGVGLESLSYWIDRLRSVEALTKRVELTFESSASRRDVMDNYRRVHRQSRWPIHFRGVKGKDTSVALDTFTGTDSWQNNDEADAAVEIVDALIQNGVNPMKIGVMSPFRGQVVAVRKRCRAKHYHDVNVGTIENFQGVEQDVIILSLTRSNPSFVESDVKKRMGVFGMPKQANVALTRAENLFIVIGNPEPMWEDELWRQWLYWVFRNGLWYGEGLEEWDLVSAKSMDANFVDTLDQVDIESNGADAIVVSTIEKVHRVHSTDEM
eukprot:CAMPEP_0201717586 /NCGR_PEP_ID=MMETSP0593-20130828/3283_1 /ASSEMBLY_ACC=CAM_ASM_000672 /TAXON_ID=267983 /ORGANISM="Skeletonema japonicum, Strain CCMP2506" /LENGTH=1033 /DNA_ID=CAMNT_0048207681 /DNA_START=56 /DNA_END=3157 /DNA_ORIENTATION=-